MDDGVRERAGVRGYDGGFANAREDGDYVSITVSNGATSVDQSFSPAAVRTLTRQLRRLARRIEERGAE